MTTKRKTETAAQPTAVNTAFLLAELMHMRRVERYAMRNSPATTWWYECDLCQARSANNGGEIHHADHCPVLRLK